MSSGERTVRTDPSVADTTRERPLWQVVIDALEEAVIAADLSNTVLYANEATRSLLGWDPEDLVGGPLTRIIPPRFQGPHLAGFARFAETQEGTVVGRPIRVPALRSDGTEASVELMISTVRLGSHLTVVGLLRDAADRIDLEGISELTDRLLAVLSGADDFERALVDVLRSLGESLHWDLAQLWQPGVDGVLHRRSHWSAPAAQAHPEFEQASGGSFELGEGLPGRVWATGEPEWVRDVRVADNFRRAVAAEEAGLCSAFAFPLSAGGELVGVIELLSIEGRDRSDELTHRLAALGQRIGWFLERRAAEVKRDELVEVLTFQTALLEAQTEAGLEGQLIVSPEGEMVSLNRRFAEMWGFSADLLERRSDAEALAAAAGLVADPETFVAIVEEAYASGQPRRDEILLLDGRVIDRVGVPLRDGDVNVGYAWYFRDVTEAKELQVRLLDAGARSAALARTLQRSLLPPQLPAIDGVQVAARYHPGGAGSEVGGDFYDLFRVGRSWGFVIGDVCGKGAEAAVVTALVRYTVRAAAHQMRSPAKALSVVNDAMLSQADEEGLDRFATAVYGHLRTRPGSIDITLACAGHPKPLLRRANGEVEEVGRFGTLLGVMPSVSVFDATLRLERGDVLVLVTDGVIEARRDGEQFGDRLLHEVVAATAGTPDEIAEAIEAAALAHQGGTAADDIAILALGVA